LASDRPITAASETSGSAPTTASISAGLIHSPPGLDQVLGPAGDHQVALGVDARQVAGRRTSRRRRSPGVSWPK
jgi:hypothetical protein